MLVGNFNHVTRVLMVAMCLVPLVGCRSAFQPQDLVPASEVLNASCCEPNTEEQINFLTLRQTPPQDYILGAGDTLGIYIQGVTGDKDTPPPVHFPNDSSMSPGLGYPVPIRDDGFISLPLVRPIRVEGLTMGQAESRIQQAYTRDKKILLEGNEKIIVTLMKRRTYNILVIREDVADKRQFSGLRNNTDYFVEEKNQGQTYSIDLPAYENDVLHALSETGGMPTEAALNEILILRGGRNNANMQGGIVQAVDQLGNASTGPTMSTSSAVRIPIKGNVNTFPNLTESDVILEDGDVVYIKGRQRDVFFTSGLLDGGRYPLPRDYEIDVLEAMSMAGGSNANRGASIRSGVPPTQVTVLRKCGCEQVAIDVDLRYAMSDPTERVIIQPGDMIILEYRRRESAINNILSVFQFSGIYRLFN